MGKVHKFIDLSVLPRFKNRGSLDGCIIWSNSIGYKLYFEYGNVKDILEIISYDKDTGLVEIKYKNTFHKIISSSLYSCKLGKVLNKNTRNFKVEIGTIFKDSKRNMTITDNGRRTNGSNKEYKRYKYTCNKCGWTEGWIDEYNLLGGKGCSCCANHTVVKGINDIATTAHWMVKYLVDKEDAYKYTKTAHKNVKVNCPDCGSIKDNYSLSSLYKLHSIACNCGDGKPYPEKFVYNILSQVDKDFIPQLNRTTFSWCQNYAYDFYYDKFSMIIETHGSQHYLGNGWKSKEEIQQRDHVKNKLAKSNSILNYIELDCRYSNKEHIKNSIMNSELTNYFDFSQVDWDKADEFATKNLVKEVCTFYEEHKNKMLIKDICVKFNISDSCFDSYIKQGESLGWCKKKEYYNKSRKIKVIETNEVFNSIRECCRKFEEIHGIKLHTTSVCDVLKKKSEIHKGFHFIYA